MQSVHQHYTSPYFAILSPRALVPAQAATESHDDCHTLDREYGLEEDMSGCMGYFKHQGTAANTCCRRFTRWSTAQPHCSRCAFRLSAHELVAIIGEVTFYAACSEFSSSKTSCNLQSLCIQQELMQLANSMHLARVYVLAEVPILSWRLCSWQSLCSNCSFLSAYANP